MIRFSSTLVSTVGKKIYMSVMGLMLSGFLLVHLVGNLTLLSPDKDPFNKYAHFLTHGVGNAIYVAELILGSLFLIHLIYGIIVQIGNWSARPVGYKKVTGAGHTSRKTIFSVTMIWTGLIIIIFLVLHLLHFKFGEIIMYEVEPGVVIRDLYSIVVAYYQNVWQMLFYCVVMLLVGFHLAHGFWSAFQSLGMNGPRFTKFVIIAGYFFAFIVGFGFFLIPLIIFFKGGAA